VRCSAKCLFLRYKWAISELAGAFVPDGGSDRVCRSNQRCCVLVRSSNSSVELLNIAISASRPCWRFTALNTTLGVAQLSVIVLRIACFKDDDFFAFPCIVLGYSS
jgi:hypothetical protein